MAGWIFPVVLLSLFLRLSSSPSIASTQGIEGFSSRTLKQDELHNHEVHCSRERSRAAWKIIEEYLMPFIEHQKYNISSKCRLHPDNDMFRDQELHKVHVDTSEWQCGFCKKSFRAERYIDQHFDNRHYDQLDHGRGKCLADLCGALHCDQVIEAKLPKSKCNPAAATKNRRLCENLADSCFPVHQGLAANQLHDLFLRQFCDAHTCTGKQKPFTRGGKKETSVIYLVISILTMMVLGLFYVIYFLYQREMKNTVQDMKRISKTGRKPKPS